VYIVFPLVYVIYLELVTNLYNVKTRNIIYGV